MIKRVKVRFVNQLAERNMGGQEYDYLTMIDVEKGDFVVVETRHGLSVAKVSRSVRDSAPNFKGSAYVVQKVDLDEYEAQKARVSKIEEIKESIDSKLRQKLYVKQITELAEGDEELTKLLATLQTLENNKKGDK